MTTKRFLYDNILMVSKEGHHMCRLSARRANWYVKRNLGSLIESDGDEPLMLQINFEPNGPGDAYDVMPKNNVCVVCGGDDALTLHHVVPRCFREHMPLKYKSRLSHDVVSTCVSCHECYETHAALFKKELINKFGFDHLVRAYSRAAQSAFTLLLHQDRMPKQALDKCFNDLEEYFGKDVTYENIWSLVQNATHRRDRIAYEKIVDSYLESNSLDKFVYLWFTR